MPESSEMIEEKISEAATTEAESPVDGPETEDPTEAPAPGNKAARDAARYRTQLREAESQLEVLNTKLDALQCAEVNRVAGEVLAEAGDLFALNGTTVADYVGDDGTVDTKAVFAAAHELVKARPGLRRPDRVRDPSQGLGYDGPRSGPSWSNLFDR